MKQFTQEEQTEIVRNAMNLTATIDLEEREVSRIKAERYKSLPQPPERKILPKPGKINPQYPQAPRSNYKYSQYLQETAVWKKILPPFVIAIGAEIIDSIIGSIAFFSTIIGSVSLIAFTASVPWAIVCLVLAYQEYSLKRKKMDEELAQSPEYVQAVKDADKSAEEAQKQIEEETRQQQAELDKKYREQKNHYDNVTVPEYNKALAMWKEQRSKKIAVIEEELTLNYETLNRLYDATRIISASYRELGILSWLYKDMSTSDHDIRYATELLDRDRQRILTEEAGRETRNAINRLENSMMNGLYAIYGAIEDGNAIQSSTVELLSKTRRDINIGNFVGTVQRHHTNKTLDSLLNR